MTAYFVFDANEQLIWERISFDTLTLLKQLFGNLDLRSPRSWPLAVRVLRGVLAMTSAPDPRLLATPPWAAGSCQ